MSLEFRVTFEKSCASLGDLPPDGAPEIALVGRSNVGKSSLLNALAGQHNLARTSRTPGRTRLLNLFAVNRGLVRLVDCPGYGYAKASRRDRAGWGDLVEAYLSEREALRLVLLLVDARLKPQALDQDMAAWLRRRGRTVQLVATKWDRLSGNQRPVARRELEGAFAAAPLEFSSISGEGREALRQAVVRQPS